MSNKRRNLSKLRCCIRAPFRLLGKVKNLYVRCMYDCSGCTNRGNDMGLPPLYFSSKAIRTFPSCDDDDFRELIRANSVPNTMDRFGSKIEIDSKSDMVKKVEMEILQLRQERQAEAVAKKVRRRKSCEVFGTIDEDKPCEFGDDLKMRTDFLQLPRSRSCSVTKRIGVIC